MKKYFILLFTGIIFYSCSLNKDVDLILQNGRIYTLDSNNSIVEAVAIRNGKIVATGKNEEILTKYNSTNIIDLEGKYVYPGFIDAHGHLLTYGSSLTSIDCNNVTSAEEIARMVAERAKNTNPGEWIIGHGWDQNLWLKKEFPTHYILDEAAPDNPVLLIRTDGHAVWVNVNTMIEAGITPNTKEPEGGKIIKAIDGEPTGIFIDNAIELINRVREDLTPEQKEEAILGGVNKLVEFGITEIHDMGVNEDLINIYKKLVKENKMPIRICVYISDVEKTWNEYKGKQKDLLGNGFLTVCGLKLFMDGALGSRGAALIEPYSDDKTDRGLTILSESEVQSITEDALKHNMQVAVHAIGDRGNSIVLTAFEKALKNSPKKDSRLRIEHAQILHPDDITKFSEYEIIPSVQPVHATSDMYWVEARLGSTRTKNSYLWKTFIDKGSKIASGSDFPVESPNIIENYYAAVTRKDKNGAPNSWSGHKHLFSYDKTDIDTSNYSNGWYAKEKMSRLEALKSFTEWAAYSVFQEKIKGTIEVGKYADFVILSGDILELKEENILSVKVLKTIVNGEIVFENDN